MSMRGELLFKVCPQCGNEFSYMKSKERKFCSKECYIQSKQTGTDIKCDNCGKVFHRRQYHIDRQKNQNQNNFCCPECQKEYLHKQRFEYRECEVCGKSFEVSKRSTQRFCSDECQHVWQTTRVAELNPQFKSILTPCSYCGCDHYVKPYKFNEQEHFFCSIECRQAWYAEVFSQQEEFKDASRQRILKQLENGMFGTDTLPQKMVNQFLDDLEIDYIREKIFDFFTVDNYIPFYNLIIEVQGDYWHTNPTVFTNKITKVQYDRIGRDKAKHSYFKNRHGINILYLWEYDIIHNEKLCKKIIEKYINENGVLQNYNSFNYTYENDVLLLKQNIVPAYQEMSVDEYKFLLQVVI